MSLPKPISLIPGYPLKEVFYQREPVSMYRDVWEPEGNCRKSPVWVFFDNIHVASITTEGESRIGFTSKTQDTFLSRYFTPREILLLTLAMAPQMPLRDRIAEAAGISTDRLENAQQLVTRYQDLRDRLVFRLQPVRTIDYQYAIDNIFYESGEVSVSNSSSKDNPNPSYVRICFGKEVVAIIDIDPETGRIRGMSEGKRNLLIIALDTAKDMPFRDDIIKVLDVTGDELAGAGVLREKYEEYKSRHSRVTPTRETLEWGSMTDPKEHNPDYFAYIVHGLSGDSNHSQQRLVDLYALRDGEEIATSYENPLAKPELFVTRSHISCSLITQDYHNLWMNKGGLILKVPRENIRKAAPEDLGTVSVGDEYDAYLPDPAWVLHGGLNEVSIAGVNKQAGTQIEIEGGIIIVDPLTGAPVDKELARNVRLFCEKLGLPVIELGDNIAL